MGSSTVRSPGIKAPVSLALYRKTFSAHFFDTVRAPAKNTGAINDGWKAEYLKTAAVDGKLPSNGPVIRDRIEASAADSRAARLFQRRHSRLIEQGKVPEYVLGCGTTEMQRNVIAPRAWSCPVEQGAVYE